MNGYHPKWNGALLSVVTSKLMGHRPVLSDDVTDSYKQLMVSFRSVALWLKPG